jgi:rRNA-processing protein FCF1
MSRLRIYVDTSVIGGCFDEEFDEYSVQLFDEFISRKKTPIISDVVLFELEGTPVHCGVEWLGLYHAPNHTTHWSICRLEMS